MKTIGKAQMGFESKGPYHSNFYLSKAIWTHENQHFIVPWQMEEEREIPREEVCHQED